ncbi:MAG: porin [Burkholderiaceae bacterium]
MKPARHTLRILVAASLSSCLAVGAHAQSSVNIYGLVDLSVGTTKAPGGTSTTALSSGKMTTSYLGFSGSEDLGGGLSAVFRIEGFMRVDSGATGRFDADTTWSRTSSVGLSSKTLGTLTLGRNTTSLFVNTLMYNALGDSFGYSPSIRHYFTSGTVTGDTGWSQSLAYSSPTFGGFRGGFAATSRTGNGSNVAFNLNYGEGPFSAGLAAQQVKKDTATTSLDDTRTVQLGMAYDFGAAKVYGQLGTVKNLSTENSYDIAGLGVRVPLGGGALVAQYGSLSPDVGADRDTLSVGYVYNLSKRTDVYVVAMSDKVDGLSSGNGASVGMRHRF